MSPSARAEVSRKGPVEPDRQRSREGPEVLRRR